MKSQYQTFFRLLIFIGMLCLLITSRVHRAAAQFAWSPPKPGAFLQPIDAKQHISLTGEAQDLILLGEPLDEDGPLTTDPLGEPNPVDIDQPLYVSATVDDSYYGGSLIASAQYSLDNGANWSPMNAVDGRFDQVSEQVEATSQAPTIPGTYSLCVHGTDINGNTGLSACTALVVYIPDLQGPQTFDLKLDPNPALAGQSVALSATLSDQDTGGSIISSGEYSQDDGTNWLPLPATDGEFDDITEQVSVVVQAPAAAGSATYCMRGTDELGNTGQESCLTLAVYTPDQEGPNTIDLVADPNPAEAGRELLITAVVDDRFTGGSAIQSAEYSLDNGGTWHSMQVADGAWDESVEGVWVDATAPEPAGIYDVCVRGQDSNGDTGPKTCLSLPTTTPDQQGPVSSEVTPEPEPVETRAQLALSAVVDESNTGGTLIQSAQYSLDNGINWSEMIAQDGAFDAVQEIVTVSLTAPSEAGVYDVCVRGVDQQANVGESECIPITVYASTAQKELSNRLSLPLMMVNFQHQ